MDERKKTGTLTEGQTFDGKTIDWTEGKTFRPAQNAVIARKRPSVGRKDGTFPVSQKHGMTTGQSYINVRFAQDLGILKKK